MHIHINPWISKWISIKTWIIEGYIYKTMDFHGYSCYGYHLSNILAWISMLRYQYGYPHLWGIED